MEFVFALLSFVCQISRIFQCKLRDHSSQWAHQMYNRTQKHTMLADCDVLKLKWKDIAIEVAIFSSSVANHDDQSLNIQKEWIAWGARQSFLIYSICLGVYLPRIRILSIAKSLSNANRVDCALARSYFSYQINHTFNVMNGKYVMMPIYRFDGHKFKNSNCSTALSQFIYYAPLFFFGYLVCFRNA